MDLTVPDQLLPPGWHVYLLTMNEPYPEFGRELVADGDLVAILTAQPTTLIGDTPNGGEIASYAEFEIDGDLVANIVGHMFEEREPRDRPALVRLLLMLCDGNGERVVAALLENPSCNIYEEEARHLVSAAQKEAVQRDLFQN